MGLFAASAIDESTFILTEIDESIARNRHKGSSPQTIRSLVSSTKIGREWHKGIVSYLLHEVDLPDFANTQQRQDTFGIGAQFFPRPHFEFELFWGHVLIRESSAMPMLVMH